jgi:hypothetical protein
MDDHELLKQLDASGYDHAIQYFNAASNYDIMMDELKDVFNEYHNK